MHLQILILLLILRLTKSSQVEGCYGLLEENAEGVLCCVVTSKWSSPIDCSNHFDLNTKLRFKCKDLYAPVQSFDRGWQNSTCLGNNRWSGHSGFNKFRCKIDAGYWQKSDADDTTGFTPLIFNGFVKDPVQTPWNAVIFYVGNGISYEFKCGGTLIDAHPYRPQYILTAAHCVFYDPLDFERQVSPQELMVVLAAHSGNFQDATSKLISPNAKTFNVKNYIIHPAYEGVSNAFLNDIAILTLETKVSINPYILPIPLPLGTQSEALSQNFLTLEVVGFGITNSETGTVSKKLYGLNVTTNQPECRNFLHTTINYASQICTVPEDKTTQLCPGDSGGGAFLKDGFVGLARYYLQGVVSIGLTDTKIIRPSSCFNVSIFTKVFPFVSWIQQQIQSSQPPEASTTKSFTTTTTTTRLSDPQPTTKTTTTPIPSPPPPSSPFPDYAWTALELHNQYRTQHSAPYLTLNKQLQDAAEEWANYLVRNNYQITPNPRSIYGQNYYEYKSSISISANDLIERAIKFWYSQKQNYNPTNTGYSSTFTQLVWKSTRELGIFISTQGQRSVVMAMYNPPGNVPGQYEANVFMSGAPPSPFSSTPTPTPIQVSDSSFQIYMTDLHNLYRTRHGAAPLRLDYQLSSRAQSYADFLTQNNYVLQPKYGEPYGQNIFENDGKVLGPSEAVRLAVDKWYSGISGYSWSYPFGSAPTGYLFSQVVWKASTKIGVGVSSSSRRTVVICFYSPPGNVQSLDSYKENVAPPNY